MLLLNNTVITDYDYFFKRPLKLIFEPFLESSYRNAVVVYGQRDELKEANRL